MSAAGAGLLSQTSRELLERWRGVKARDIPPQYRRAIMQTLETAKGADGLLDYIPRVSPRIDGFDTLRPNHLSPVAVMFARAETEPIRVCLSCPPRHSKTELIVHGASWFLARHPEKHVIYVAGTLDLALKFSRKCKRYFVAAGGKLKQGEQSAAEWSTTSGGSFKASGITGHLPGYGADLFVVDDYIGSRQQAESSKHREASWERFQGSVATRVHPGGSIIIVQTRWHEEDIIGVLAAEHAADWEIFNFTCIAEDDDPLGREPGELLWPEFWSLEEVEAKRRLVGEIEWSAQYQGDPKPKGLRLFQGKTFVEEDDLRKIYGHSFVMIAADHAVTSKTSSDYTAIGVALGYASVDHGGMPMMTMIDMYRDRYTPTQFGRKIVELNKHWSRDGLDTPVLIEANQGGDFIVDAITKIDPSVLVVPIHVSKDKYTRAMPASVAWNQGRIQLRQDQEWEKPLLKELLKFTGVDDDYDDQVDVISMLYNAFADNLPQPEDPFDKAGRRKLRRPKYLPFG